MVRLVLLVLRMYFRLEKLGVWGRGGEKSIVNIEGFKFEYE